MEDITDPWSYQVDILVLSMDLTAGKTWDQLCNTKSDVLLTWVLTGHGPSTSLGCRDGPQAIFFLGGPAHAQAPHSLE